ncbi:hypothetical protein KIH39_22940 [Telmatocola sphagniphila]|uniref:Carboxypeptidase regulatory-like domain-containing protein n=1 Tax=Telmatocola sphagniphila TaxID=1123043 RepID=A0A8E6B769_9BACT|nr:hypothetical protein [Telmatocola sphagniphila]QVL31670.1 hypothetical protein KIH39_22940 [Telmatocola sphagniphila]
MRRILFGLFVIGSGLTLCGCGRSDSLYSVRGKIRYRGEPAVGALITFVPQDTFRRTREPMAQAVVSEDGSFELAGPSGPGARPGEYVVLVEWKEGAGKTRGRSPALNAPDRLKKKYLNPDKPLLKATIEAKSNDLPPFEIE